MTNRGASTAFLSASTLSALSNASSSITEPIDLELVEEIIERAPRSATSFPLVYRAYGQVLEEHGLSASTDTAYYQFLLKLGVIRAPTWGEKWDLYRTTQTIVSRPSPRKQNHSSPRKDAHTRARVPFLASASSDLDEGYGDETYEGDAESLINLVRPSPRKVLRDCSRSLVGFTPSKSLDYETLTLNPPIRTSTPVYAQESGRTTPPLPPYSVSDVSDMIDASKTDEPSTPQAKHIGQAIHEDLINENIEREMEARADEFYRTGLMGRCWDVWAQSYDWVKSTTDQIDRVRSTILLRQTLTKWRDAHDRLLSLPATADQHRRMALQSQAFSVWINRVKLWQLDKAETAWNAKRTRQDLLARWRKWRTAVIVRRTERWKREVARKEKVFIRTRNTQLVSETLERWYEAMRDRVDGKVAAQHHTQTALRHSILFWLHRASLQRKLANVLDDQDADITRSTFQTWVRQGRLAQAEKLLTEKHETSILHRVWDLWRIVHHRSREARLFDQTRILSKVLVKWKERRLRIQALQYKATTWHRASVTQVHLHIWVTKERGSLYQRVRDVRLQSRLFALWRDRRSGVIALETHGEALAQRFLQSSLQRSFSRWRARLGDHHHKIIQAVLLHEASEKRHVGAALVKWQLATARIQANKVTAVKAKAFFVQRQSLRVWRARLRAREQLAYLEQRRIDETRLWFDAWRLRTKQSQADTKTTTAFQREQIKRTLTSMLVRWTARVVEIKSREHDVVKQRNLINKRDALLRWTIALHKLEDAKALMQSFIQIRSEEYLRKVLMSWRDEALRLRNLRMQSEKSLIERDDRLLAEKFSLWREKVREKGLIEVETEVAICHEDALMFAVWDKWKARSTRLPEIAFAKRRILTSAWMQWRRAMDIRQRERSIAEPRDQQLLLDIIAVWREATKRRIALSASRRRGRIRPGAVETSRRASGGQTPEFSHGIPPRTLKAGRRVTMNLPPRLETPRHAEDVESVASEFAYSRLRSELYGRRRGGSEEPENRAVRSSSELVKQLRGTLGR